MTDNSSVESISALQENIINKGKNSYYYAHSMKVEGPKWDGREEPRLLQSAEKISNTPTIKYESLTDYSWLEESKYIRIYVDYENADQVDDSLLKLEHDNFFVKFFVANSDKTFVLHVDSLYESIESVSFRKKQSKFIITLMKSVEKKWYQLRKSK